nr:hypothetical protein [Odoribacter splanchnicus]
MTKVEREVVFNSENGQKEMTGVRHSDDDVKKKVIDCVFKLGQLNNIPEKYVEKNSDCSRSWGVCTGVISTVGVLYQIGQLSLIFSLV